MTTPFSTNVVSALCASGISEILRVEKSRRYMIKLAKPSKSNKYYQQIFDYFLLNRNSTQLLNIFGDKMTECEYSSLDLPNFINEKQNEEAASFSGIIYNEVII